MQLSLETGEHYVLTTSSPSPSSWHALSPLHDPSAMSAFKVQDNIVSIKCGSRNNEQKMRDRDSLP